MTAADYTARVAGGGGDSTPKRKLAEMSPSRAYRRGSRIQIVPAAEYPMAARITGCATAVQPSRSPLSTSNHSSGSLSGLRSPFSVAIVAASPRRSREYPRRPACACTIVRERPSWKRRSLGGVRGGSVLSDLHISSAVAIMSATASSRALRRRVRASYQTVALIVTAAAMRPPIHPSNHPELAESPAAMTNAVVSMRECSQFAVSVPTDTPALEGT